MITVYLRNGDLAEVNADTIENRLWDLADGSQSSSLVLLDGDGEVMGQFFADQIAGWAYTEDDVFDFDDEDEDEDEDQIMMNPEPHSEKCGSVLLAPQ